MNRNLTVKMGDCDHPPLHLPPLRARPHRAIDPATVMTQDEPLVSAVEAYTIFDQRAAGWTKSVLDPAWLDRAATDHELKGAIHGSAGRREGAEDRRFLLRL